MDWDAAEFFRAQARKCIKKADEIADLRLKGHWVDVGATWWVLADAVERRDGSEGQPSLVDGPTVSLSLEDLQ